MRMKQRVSSAVLSGLIAVAAAWPLQAQQRQPAPAPPKAGASPELDVMLVLDNSGSMRDSDPQRLMAAVASSFAERLGVAARMGVVVFDERAAIALGLGAVADPDFSTRLAKALEQLTYRGSRTNLPAAVERGLYELRENARPGRQAALVFLTDGIVDVGNAADNLDKSNWLREELTHQAKREHVRIFGIALSDEADFQLIQSVSEMTDGAHYRVLEAEAVAGVFDQVATRLAESLDDGAAEVAEPPQHTATALPAQPPMAELPSATSGFGWPWVAGPLVLALVALALLRDARRPRVPSAQLQRVDERATAAGKREQSFSITKAETRIGRDEAANDLVVPVETVSARHAVIEYRDGSFFLRDLDSGNGTYRVTGGSRQRVQEVTLQHGDTFAVDQVRYRFFRGAIPDAADGGPEPGATVLGHGSTYPAPQAIAPDDEATKFKTEKCANHESWGATGICVQCQREFCDNCLHDHEGLRYCADHVPGAKEEASA